MNFKGISSKNHQNILMALVAACVVISLTSSHTIAQASQNPLIKLAILACVMMTTYVSPILGGVLAACFIYCISANGFIEGLDADEDEDEDEDEGYENVNDDEEEDEEGGAD